MSQTKINACQTPLPKQQRRNLAAILASAFAEDSTMLKLLGHDRWQKIAAAYFFQQLSFSDVVITVCRDNQTIGVLAARTPDCPANLRQTLIAPLATRYLLGNAYQTSSSLGREIAAHLPAYPYSYINHLGVLPSEQGQGTAGQLLAHLHDSTDWRVIFVDCETEVAPVYQKYGYTITHTCGDGKLVIMRHGNTH